MKALLVFVGVASFVPLAVALRYEAAQPLLKDPLGQRYVLATLGGEAELYTLAFSPDGRTLWAAGSAANKQRKFVLTAWDVKARRVAQVIPYPGNARLSRIALSPSGARLAAADIEGGVAVLSQDGKTLNRFKIEDGRCFTEHLSFPAEGQVFAVGSIWGVGQRWDVATSRTATYLFRGLKAFALSADAKLAALCTAREIAFHDGSFRRRLGAIALPADHNIRDLAFSHDKAVLLGAAKDGMLHLFDVRKKEEVREWQGHDRGLYAVRVMALPAARAFVTADSAGKGDRVQDPGRLQDRKGYRAECRCYAQALFRQPLAAALNIRI